VDALGGAFNPGSIGLRAAAGAAVDAVFADPNFNSGEGSLALFELTAGDFVVEVVGEGGSAGDFRVSVFLPGDRNSDGRVDVGDTAAAMAAAIDQTIGLNAVSARMYRSLGVNTSTPLYNAALDADCDGEVSAIDAEVVAHNASSPGATFALAPNAAMFSLPENSALGTILGTVEPRQLAGAANLQFLLTPGGDSDAVAIDAASGELTVADPARLDFEVQPQLAFTVNVTQTGGAGETIPVRVNLLDVNEVPTVVADALTTAEDVPLTFDLANLLANDLTGPVQEQGQTLNVTRFDANSTAGGTVVDNLDGTLTYSPPSNFNGADSFTYTATDDGKTAEVSDPLAADATVSITVTSVNDAPIGGADADTTIVNVPRILQSSTLLANDVTGPPDESSQTKKVQSVSPDSAQGGMVTLNPAGTITYFPPTDFIGEDTFEYELRDNGQTNGVDDPQSTQ
ncbi:MAG: tandem-95 repeat protein, partial [Planctomycetales bacterium]|nr:tandem-95 repeat protein [Planctomycetales bacterium]